MKKVSVITNSSTVSLDAKEEDSLGTAEDQIIVARNYQLVGNFSAAMTLYLDELEIVLDLLKLKPHQRELRDQCISIWSEIALVIFSKVIVLSLILVIFI